ncbi:unnamed protein product, partial [Polarella glacialis]
ERQAPVQRPRSAPCSSAVPRPSLLSSTQPGRRDLWGEVATGVTQHLVNQAARPQSPGQVTFEGLEDNSDSDDSDSDGQDTAALASRWGLGPKAKAAPAVPKAAPKSGWLSPDSSDSD